MGAITQNKFTVNARLLALEQEMVELRKQYGLVNLQAGPQGVAGQTGQKGDKGDPGLPGVIS